jgi:Spy/CpxP family protein refolding chaperone
MKTVAIVATMAITLSVSSVTTLAQDFDHGRHGKRGRQDHNPEMMKGKLLERILKNPELVERIGLSEEQEKALRDGFCDLGKERVAKEAELKLAAMEQARILTESEINESELMAAVEKTGRVRTELAKIQMKKLLLMHRTLDDEQRQDIANLAHEHRKSRMEQRSRGGGRKDGDHRRHRPWHDRDHDQPPLDEQDDRTFDGEE